MKNEIVLSKSDLTKFQKFEKELFVAADPITWTFILTEIGKGFLAAIGAKIFKELFDKGVDMEKLMENMLKEIDRIVAYRIEQAFINQAMIRANVVNSALLDYSNSPSDERLLEIENNSRWLVAEFKNFKHKTYKEYLVAVTYRLFAYEENLKNGVKSEKENIIRLIDESVEHIELLNDEWKPISDNRFSLGSEFFLDYDFDGRPIGSYGSYWVKENGRRISQKYNFLSSSSGRRDAQNQATNEMNRIKSTRYSIDVLEEYIQPAEKVIVNWQKRRNDLSNE